MIVYDSTTTRITDELFWASAGSLKIISVQNLVENGYKWTPPNGLKWIAKWNKKWIKKWINCCFKEFKKWTNKWVQPFCTHSYVHF